MPIELHPYEPAHGWRSVDARLRLPNDAELLMLGRRMGAAKTPEHDGSDIVPDHRIVGLHGERHVARRLGMAMDTRVIHGHGSRRCNYTLADGTRLDVLTRRPNPRYPIPDILLQVTLRHAVDAIVVVAFHSPMFEPEIVGWAWEADVRARGQIHEPARHYPNAKPNFVYPNNLFRPFWSLMAMHRPDDPEAQPPPEPVIAEKVAAALPPTTMAMFGAGEVAERRREEDDPPETKRRKRRA